MHNLKFIVYNRTKSFEDWEVFSFITENLKKGLLSNNETEYCYCTVRQFEKIELVCEINKTKNNYRIDVFEVERKDKKKDMCIKCGKYPAEYNQTMCEFCLGISEPEEDIYEVIEDMSSEDEEVKDDSVEGRVLKEAFDFCGECSSNMCCPEDECVIYRIQQICLGKDE